MATTEPVSHAARRAESLRPEKPVTMTADRWANIEERLAAHDAAMAELRADLFEAQESHALTRAKLGDALAKVSSYARKYSEQVSETFELEALLDAISPDWRTDYCCEHCEERVALPEHPLCSRCENDLEAAEDDRARQRWEDRA